MNIKNKLFAYQCIKDEPCKSFFGLNTEGRKYKIGDYITYHGPPSKDINEATINTLEDYDLFEGYGSVDLTEYFRKIEFKITKK
jgi:hypothetical protein